MGASSFIQLASLRGLDVPSSVPITQIQKQKLRVKYAFEVTGSGSGRGRDSLPRSAGRIQDRGLIVILVTGLQPLFTLHQLILHCIWLLCHFVLSCSQLFVALWTVAHRAPLSMEFSRQEYWNGLSFPSPLCLLRLLPSVTIPPSSLVFHSGQLFVSVCFFFFLSAPGSEFV